MARSDFGEQLGLPLPLNREPRIADAPAVAPRTVVTASKMATDPTNAELLTALLGSANALPCEHLTTSYPSLREIGRLNSAVLSEHGFAAGALARLEAVFELAKRYGETEWCIGDPFRGAADICPKQVVTVTTFACRGGHFRAFPGRRAVAAISAFAPEISVFGEFAGIVSATGLGSSNPVGDALFHKGFSA